MHEISPVLAGTFDAADYLPAASNINMPASDSVDGSSNSAAIDSRRYSKFDHSAADVQTVDNFTFSDFLDLVNPLQHIPGLSSIYRSATGDTINPVSRVAGDILYGGLLGAASAVLGGVTAIGDAVMEAQTGKDSTGNVFASLFGGSDKETVQLASADTEKTKTAEIATTTTPITPPAPAAATPADNTISPTLASMTAASIAAVTKAPLTSTPVATLPAATIAAPQIASAAQASSPIAAAKAIPLDRSKMPYGGVMDMGNNIEAQNRIIALSEGSHTMRLGNTIYTGRLMNGPHPMPVMTQNTAAKTANIAGLAANAVPATPAPVPTSAAPVSPAPATAANPAMTATSTANTDTSTTGAIPLAAADTANIGVGGITGTPHKNPLPQNLINDMVMMKALGQYKGIASGPTNLGASLDVTN